MIEFGHASHTGLCRAHNEDTYWVDAGAGLFLVADGMGGPGRGEVAAAIACDALVDATRAGRDLEAAIRTAATTIAAHAPDTTARAPMGATLAALQLQGEQFRAFRIGDSRVALWHRGRLQPIDFDNAHAPPPDGDDAAADAAADAPSSVRRNRITQALGITPPDELCATPACGTLEHGMQFLLCSDGLSEAVDDAGIAAILSRSGLAAQECVDQLVLAALDAGGHDNVTVLLVRVA